MLMLIFILQIRHGSQKRKQSKSSRPIIFPTDKDTPFSPQTPTKMTTVQHNKQKHNYFIPSPPINKPTKGIPRIAQPAPPPVSHVVHQVHHQQVEKPRKQQPAAVVESKPPVYEKKVSSAPAVSKVNLKVRVTQGPVITTGDKPLRFFDNGSKPKKPAQAARPEAQVTRIVPAVVKNVFVQQPSPAKRPHIPTIKLTAGKLSSVTDKQG
jgi:hypothetical protein